MAILRQVNNLKPGLSIIIPGEPDTAYIVCDVVPDKRVWATGATRRYFLHLQEDIRIVPADEKSTDNDKPIDGGIYLPPTPRLHYILLYADDMIELASKCVCSDAIYKAYALVSESRADELAREPQDIFTFLGNLFSRKKKQ